MDIINTARMDIGGKGGRRLKKGEEFPLHFAHFWLFFFSYILNKLNNSPYGKKKTQQVI